MAMGAHTAMHINDQILTLTQWLSPAYPIGAFAYSHGLEWLVETEAVKDATTLESWLRDLLKYGAGQSDALFLAAAYQADGQSLAEIDATCRAFAPSKERLMETDLQGAAFCKVTSDIWAQQLEGLCYPVALGRAASLAGLPASLTLRIYLQAFASNLLAAGLRLLSVGQTEGQRLIKSLAPLITEIADKAETASLDDLSGTAFLTDIASMKHETQYSRIFRT